jgi:hypothetical protein
VNALPKSCAAPSELDRFFLIIPGVPLRFTPGYLPAAPSGLNPPLSRLSEDLRTFRARLRSLIKTPLSHFNKMAGLIPELARFFKGDHSGSSFANRLFKRCGPSFLGFSNALQGHAPAFSVPEKGMIGTFVRRQSHQDE